ncbi:elongator complex protein 5-like [Ornithodoros turicata]|uniref:elongator complex protein 5-like n=1 Tax=Ornithodoros turicata TaxID=34597 RepID=UPI0031389A33
MLQNLLSRKDTSGIALIYDSLERTAGLFVRCVISTWINRGAHVNVLCFDADPKDYLAAFPENDTTSLMASDCFTNPFGKDDLQSECQYNPNTWDKLIDSTKCSVLVVDSLSTILLHQDFTHVYNTLVHLSRNAHVQQIVCIVHTDVHDESLLASLSYIATTTVTLKPTVKPTDLSAMCHIVHKKPGGRAAVEEEQFEMTPELTICNIKKIQQEKAVPKAAQVDPTANLTFNLRLSEGEKDARDKVVLPYLKKPDLPEHPGTGSITYTLEKEDDFDEEDDPDDDLTF